MHENQFSPAVLPCLIAAGWYPGRKIDPAPYRAMLEASHFTVFAAAAQFLSAFGGLTIVYTYEEDIPLRSGAVKRSTFTTELCFDDYGLEDAISADLATHYAEQLQTVFCVIGLLRNGGMVLLMDPQGHVYGGYGEDLYVVGATSSQALERLLLGRGPLPRFTQR